jgi:type I restriction enzyme, S subunit
MGITAETIQFDRSDGVSLAKEDQRDVPAGFKRTRVGLIPKGWQIKSVRELGKITTGPFGTLLKAEEYTQSDGVPLISVGEVGVATFHVSDKTPRVPTAVTRRLPQYVLRAGDIVFGRKGAVERSALVTKDEDGWFLGSDGISLRPFKECFAPYLAWQFQ